MTIRYSKNFEKQFKKLPAKIKEKFYVRQALFETNQQNPILRVHALNGTCQGFYSMDITGDVRALFTKNGTTIVIFGFIGTHSKLY
jgi:mRNA-degrading endonuclease YafQ of YafQ-DinJ toxin-antitoxin module